MIERSGCRRRRLAARPSFSVDVCECGAVHLTVGYTTMRLDEGAFREMAAMLAEALSHLSPRPQHLH